LVPGDTNAATDVFVRDRVLGTTTRISVSTSGQQGNADSSLSVISADGQSVVFTSDADNLVPGDTNQVSDVFVRDLVRGETGRVSLSSTGEEANEDSFNSAVSADGRYVAFDSAASNLVPGDTNDRFDVFVRDRLTGVTERVSLSSTGAEGDDESILPWMSADG